MSIIISKDGRCSSSREFSLNHSVPDTPGRDTVSNRQPLLHCFFEGHDMQWIDASRDIVLADYDHYISSNRDEVGMGDGKVPTIRQVENERSKAVLNAVTDILGIH